MGKTTDTITEGIQDVAGATVPHGAIVARFSHLSQECHRWGGTHALEFSSVNACTGVASGTWHACDTDETNAARSTAMGSTTDKIKGRVKEAVGVITDNDRLKREGQTDQAVGEVKEAAEKVKDTVKRVVEKIKDA